MTWFKVDDKLHDHRKVRVAGTRAMGVWLLAGSWSAGNLTDGFVPSKIAMRWGDRKDFSRLVAAGLWKPEQLGDEDGYRFQDWTQYQPSRAEIEEHRALHAERMRSWRRTQKDPT